MRHALYLFALIVTLALVPVDRAHAQYRFGTDEQIHFIQDVPLKGAKDEALYLGYMTKTKNFLLGFSVEDAGRRGHGRERPILSHAEGRGAGDVPDRRHAAVAAAAVPARHLRLRRRLLAVVGPCPRGAVLGHRLLAQAQGSRAGKRGGAASLMPLAGLSAALVANAGLDRDASYGPEERDILSAEKGRAAWDAIRAWPGYAPTPLRRLAPIAAEAGVAELLYKDEGHRFGLRSFKALGGAYAVERLARQHGADGLTVACATDGNHGRAVAWGARKAGVKAVIFVHEGVSPGRADAIAALGAEVVRAGRTYDDSVRLCADAGRQNGWQIVSDTSWPGYEEVPKTVMQGYVVMVGEALAAGARPSHVFVQGGVGGLAAAVLSWLWETQGPARPVFVVVEPETAACLFASAKAGAPTSVGGDLATIMAGLSCGEPSLLAWRILARGADAFMTIPDEAAAETMRDLADLGVVGGELGVAGLAGFRLAAADPQLRTALRLDADSRVLVFGTEGATDPDVYARIVGRSAEDVAGARSARIAEVA